jgi:hypothetical protein
MTGLSRRVASAFGALTLLCMPWDAYAEGPRPAATPVSRVAPLGAGSIQGIVQDENGAPVGGAFVSALGATQAFAVTDRAGRFEIRTLSPGAYVLRAHSTGFFASHGKIVDVRPSGRSSSAIEIRRSGALRAVTDTAPAAPIMQAGIGADPIDRSAPPARESASPEPDKPAAGGDDHSELAWRLRHLRRSVLQDDNGIVFTPDDGPVSSPEGLTAASYPRPDFPMRTAASLFASAPISGEFNFLTTSAFDTPQQLFSGDMFPRSVAYMSLGAPAGSSTDWAVRAALSQADISAWVIAGTYATRGPARHHYDVGLSYATQRYDGGNPAALRDVTDGSRNAGGIYGFDTWTVSPAFTLTYGGRYGRYDYLQSQNLLSPRVSMTVAAGDHFRVNTSVSRRSLAPGAEEFLPPGDNGIWLPPQRTFSSVANGGPLDAEHISHLQVEVERDLGAGSTVSARAFQQYVEDQLVTLFGMDVPGQAPANIGHYFIGNGGDVDAHGVSAALRTGTARVRGSIEYTMTSAEWSGGSDLSLWVLRLPSNPTLRPDRVHDVMTSIQTTVPETSTRVLVLYRISHSVASRPLQDDRSLNTRFDVEVHQSLPFMDFSTAKWEMLVGIRNFFREAAADQSVFDELMVVRPPKRIVGGLTMRF